MNRSLVQSAVIVVILGTSCLAFGQDYYGGSPMQAAPYGGYGDAQQMPGYGQTATPSYPMAPQPGAYSPMPQEAQPMQGSPYQGPAQYTQPSAPSQYPQAAPQGQPYVEYPQPGAGGDPYAQQPGAASPQGAEYIQPGALIQNEIYWDPNYDRAVNGQAPPPDYAQQPQQPPVATPARTVRTEQSRQSSRGHKKGQAVSANRSRRDTVLRHTDTLQTEAERQPLQWGRQAEHKQPTERASAVRWGQSSRQEQAAGARVMSEGPSSVRRAPDPAREPQASTKLPWGSN